MSLDGFYRGVAALASNPDLVRRSRSGDEDWLHAFDLTPLEGDRLRQMARDPGMEVLCSLYRSNRLTALLRTVPTVVEALGARLRAEVDAFWASTPRPDMQFRTEGLAFCDFVRARYPLDLDLNSVVMSAERILLFNYDADPAVHGTGP